jgi:pimeloyl-ACP methyl ester carboxylesterase
MRRLSCLLVSFAIFGILQWPASGQTTKAPAENPKFEAPPPKTTAPPKAAPAPSFKHLDGQMLVYAVNGVGGATTLSDNLIELNGERHFGLRIQMVPWCRHNSWFGDLYDTDAQLQAATKIACSVAAIRKDAPHAQIFLVGHSAGARIVLAAAEMLPPKSVDRVIVMHAAVSCGYDLTGALKASKLGVDNFWSSEDWVLDHAAEKGLADGLKGPAAGKFGFRPASCDKKDLELYRHLRQYRWNENLTGSGGHYAWVLRHNLKRTMEPLFFGVPCEAPVIADPKTPPPKMDPKDKKEPELKKLP